MDSATSIVGHSKVMHHMMPDIVSPIDRRYILRYLHRNKNIRNGLDCEYVLFDHSVLCKGRDKVGQLGVVRELRSSRDSLPVRLEELALEREQKGPEAPHQALFSDGVLPESTSICNS